jgi:hypothetical protein
MPNPDKSKAPKRLDEYASRTERPVTELMGGQRTSECALMVGNSTSECLTTSNTGNARNAL